MKPLGERLPVTKNGMVGWPNAEDLQFSKLHHFAWYADRHRSRPYRQDHSEVIMMGFTLPDAPDFSSP